MAANNNRAPGTAIPEATNNAADHTALDAPHQLHLADLGIPKPAVSTPNAGEASEIAERAEILRRFLAAHPSGGTLEAALAWAGLPMKPRGRAWVVNAHAPAMACRSGWAIRSGGACRSRLSTAAHRGLVRHYLPPGGDRD